MKNKLLKCLDLFTTLFKIGLFTFGGGFAMISMLENELVERKKWFEHDEFMNLVVIAESTPGPVAINSATYVGYKQAGVLGSACATFGACLPSFIIIYIISLFFDRFMELKTVAAAFKGIQACVVYLIFSAGLKLFKKMEKKPLPLALCISTIICMVGFSLTAINFSTIFYIVIGGVVGLVTYILSDLIFKRGER